MGRAGGRSSYFFFFSSGCQAPGAGVAMCEVHSTRSGFGGGPMLEEEGGALMWNIHWSAGGFLGQRGSAGGFLTAGTLGRATGSSVHARASASTAWRSDLAVGLGLELVMLNQLGSNTAALSSWDVDQLQRCPFIVHERGSL